MKLVVGWNKGGVGTSFICSLLKHAGINHVEHRAHLDDYETEKHIRVIPLSKAEIGYFVPNPARASEFEKMLSACSEMQVIFVPNNIRPNDLKFIESELNSKSLIAASVMSISPCIPGRAKYVSGDCKLGRLTDDADLVAFIEYIKEYLGAL